MIAGVLKSGLGNGKSKSKNGGGGGGGAARPVKPLPKDCLGDRSINQSKCIQSKVMAGQMQY